MDKINIGYVQGVHGLRGDLKIKCRFDKPDRAFVVGNKIFLNEEEHIITACKLYKGFYLVTIDNIKNINLVEHYIGYDVYITREALNLKENEYLLEDLYGLEIECNQRLYGKVSEILNNAIYNILVIDYEKKYMIPLVDKYVHHIDFKSKRIICKDIEDLIL